MLRTAQLVQNPLMEIVKYLRDKQKESNYPERLTHFGHVLVFFAKNQRSSVANAQTLADYLASKKLPMTQARFSKERYRTLLDNVSANFTLVMATFPTFVAMINSPTYDADPVILALRAQIQSAAVISASSSSASTSTTSSTPAAALPEPTLPEPCMSYNRITVQDLLGQLPAKLKQIVEEKIIDGQHYRDLAKQFAKYIENLLYSAREGYLSPKQKPLWLDSLIEALTRVGSKEPSIHDRLLSYQQELKTFFTELAEIVAKLQAASQPGGVEYTCFMQEITAFANRHQGNSLIMALADSLLAAVSSTGIQVPEYNARTAALGGHSRAPMGVTNSSESIGFVLNHLPTLIKLLLATPAAVLSIDDLAARLNTLLPSDAPVAVSSASSSSFSNLFARFRSSPAVSAQEGKVSLTLQAHGLVFSGLTHEKSKILSDCLGKLNISLKYENETYLIPTDQVMKALNLCQQVSAGEVEALYLAASLNYSYCLRLSIYQSKPMRAEIDEYFYINQIEQLEEKLREHGVAETHNLLKLTVLFREEIIGKEKSTNSGFSEDVALDIINKAVKLLQQAEKFAIDPALNSVVQNYLQSLALVTLPHHDLWSISRTLANHFSPLCQHGLFVQLEKEGLKFYCAPPDDEKLFKLFGGHGFILDAEENTGVCLPAGFEEHKRVIIFPHTEVENLLRLAQYDPNQIAYTLDDFYQSKQLNRHALFIEELAAKKQLSSKVADFTVGVAATPHPDGQKTLVRVTVQAPEFFKAPPQHIILVIDDSGSMNEKGKIQAAKKATLELIQSLSDETEVTILTLNKGYLLERTAKAAIDQGVINKIQSLEAVGGTPLLEAIVAGADKLHKPGCKFVPPQEQDRAAMIVISDGDDNRHRSAEQMITALRAGYGETYAGKTVYGLGSKEYPNRRDFILVPVGVPGYNFQLVSQLGKHGYYHVPNAVDTEAAVRGASSVIAARTPPVLVGIMTPQGTVAAELPRMYAGHSRSICFEVSGLVDSADLDIGLVCGNTRQSSKARLVRKSDNLTIVVDHIRQIQDEKLTQYNQQICQVKNQQQLSMLTRSLIDDLITLYDSMGDMADPLFDSMRNELQNNITVFRRKLNSALNAQNQHAERAVLAAASRRVAGSERLRALAVQPPVIEWVQPLAGQQAAAIAAIPLARDSAHRVRVRRTISELIKTHLGYDCWLNVDASTAKFRLEFNTREAADKYCQDVNIETTKVREISRASEAGPTTLFTVPMNKATSILQLFDKIQAAELLTTAAVANRFDLRLRFVGIALEEMLGYAQQAKGATSWPSSLWFSHGRPRMVDGYGRPLNSLIEIEQALGEASNGQTKLSPAFRDLLSVVISDYEARTQQAYRDKLFDYCCLDKPRYNRSQRTLNFELVHRHGYLEQLNSLERDLFQQQLQNMISENEQLRGKVSVVVTTHARSHQVAFQLSDVATLDELLAIHNGLMTLFSTSKGNNDLLLLQDQVCLHHALIEVERLKESNLIHESSSSASAALSSAPATRFALPMVPVITPDEPELVSLLQDDISFETLVKPMITPESYTYSRQSIRDAIDYNGQDPNTRSPLSKKVLRQNCAVASLIQELSANGVNHQQLPQSILDPETNEPFKEPMVDEKGLTVEKATALKKNPDASLIKNKLIADVIKFYRPTLQPIEDHLEHVDMLKIVGAAAGMLTPGQDRLTLPEAQQGIGIPVVTVENFQLKIQFRSVIYAKRLERALRLANFEGCDLDAKGQLTFSTVKASVAFLTKICGIPAERLQADPQLAGIFRQANVTAAPAATAFFGGTAEAASQTSIAAPTVAPEAEAANVATGSMSPRTAAMDGK